MSEIKFSEPQEFILTTTQENNLFLAGVGSGKTHLAGFIAAYLVQKFPKVFGFIGANTYQQLTTSTLFRTREVWEELFGWKHGIDYVVGVHPPKSFNTDLHNFDSYSGIISFKNGALAFKGSLDNAKAHDGKEFGWALLDETKDSREEDVKETIMSRLRMPGIYVDADTYQLTDSPESLLGFENKSFNPLYIFTSPAKVAWLNEWFKLDDHQEEILSLITNEDEFFKKEFEDKAVAISSTYHNKENLPNGYIDRQLKNNGKDAAHKLIYGNPFVKQGGEFYGGFDRRTHVVKCQYRDDLPLHISFDQNVSPYITATVYQIETLDDVTYIYQIDEVCLPNPRNRTELLCVEIMKRYGGHTAGLFYYGDPSGKKRDTRANEHDYKIVERVLRSKLNNQSNRVPLKHPPVLKRRDFANNMFEGLYDIVFRIDPKCKESIKDFEFVKEDKNGKKAKEIYSDPVTGTRYEKFGHTSDSFDYFLCKAFARLFKKHFK